jgi:hypothetical protein
MATTATLVYTAVAAPSVAPAVLAALIAEANITPDIVGYLEPIWGITKASDTTSTSGSTVTRTIVLDLTAAYNADFPAGDVSLFVQRYQGVISQAARSPVVSSAPVLV